MIGPQRRERLPVPILRKLITRIVGFLLRPWLRRQMQHYEAQAEAACGAMYDERPPLAKDRYEDARLYFHRAIEMAKRANLNGAVTRLTARRDEIAQVYARQFRGVGYR
jgi:hypothetical protein